MDLIDEVSELPDPGRRSTPRALPVSTRALRLFFAVMTGCFAGAGLLLALLQANAPGIGPLTAMFAALAVASAACTHSRKFLSAI